MINNNFIKGFLHDYFVNNKFLYTYDNLIKIVYSGLPVLDKIIEINGYWVGRPLYGSSEHFTDYDFINSLKFDTANRQNKGKIKKEIRSFNKYRLYEIILEKNLNKVEKLFYNETTIINSDIAFFNSETLLKMINYCLENKIEILGIDAFNIFRNIQSQFGLIVEPIMAESIDFTDLENKNKDFNELLNNYIKDLKDTYYYEIVLDI